jgi:Holliday junction resolvase RusA-like endonuclease
MTPPVTLVIDRRPPVSLNAQERMHWTKRRQYRTQYRGEVWGAWINADWPVYERPRVTIRCYSKGNRQVKDRDNQYGAVKMLVDALKHHAYPEDDTDTIDLCVEWHVDNRWERIEIDLEERA